MLTVLCLACVVALNPSIWRKRVALRCETDINV